MEIKVVKRTELKQKPDFSNLGFGQYFSDYMFVVFLQWNKRMFLGFVLFFLGCFYAIRIEQTAGYYQCKACGHTYVPTYKAVNLAPHAGRTRYMRCPNCGKKTWQKKVLSKEK